MSREEGIVLALTSWPALESEHFTLNILDPTIRASPRCPSWYSQGSNAPFLGVETSTGLGDTFVKIEKSSPALKCVNRLLKLYAFTKREGSDIRAMMALTTIARVLHLCLWTPSSHLRFTGRVHIA